MDSRSGAAVLAFFGFGLTVYHYLSSKKKIKPELHKRQINDVLMFENKMACQLIKSKYSRFLVQPSMDRYMYYLSLTRNTLDICMFMITNCDIANTIIKLHNKGVKVRLIVDADMAYATGSATKRIEKKGIEMRWMKSTFLMHHKFCLIDASAHVEDSEAIPLLMTGSINWTHQGFLGNWENSMVTSKSELIQGFKEEFEKLWLLFRPIDK